ncbi:MAG: hypothetical protein ACFHU9_05100 [Fluviicola sp.]
MKYLFGFIFTLLSIGSVNSQETDHGKYLFPENPNMQWAVSQLGKPFTSKVEKKMSRIGKSGYTDYNRPIVRDLIFDSITVWTASNRDNVELRLYYKNNICVKVQSSVTMLSMRKGTPHLKDFAFINQGVTNPNKVRSALKSEKLDFHEQTYTIGKDFHRRTFFAAYEPKEWLINIYSASFNDYHDIEAVHFISVAMEGIDNSEHYQFISSDALYEKMDAPKSYDTFQKYLATKKQEAKQSQMLATLDLSPVNGILDLTAGICLEGCDSDSKDCIIHYGKYVYIGPTKDNLPHATDNSGKLYRLLTAYENKIASKEAYTSGKQVSGVILSGYCYTKFYSFDTNTGMAVTQPFDFPMLENKVYAKVRLDSGDVVDTNLVAFYTTPECTPESIVYKGGINSKMEMHGKGELLFDRNGQRIIIRTRWKENKVDKWALRNEDYSSSGYHSEIISNGGKHVDVNIEYLEFNADLGQFVYASEAMIKLNYETSVLENPNAQPNMRIIGPYAFSDDVLYVYGMHQKQKYRGTGSIKNYKNWETISTSNLGSKESKESCFLYGSNFYELPKCSNDEIRKAKDKLENPYKGIGFFGF